MTISLFHKIAWNLSYKCWSKPKGCRKYICKPKHYPIMFGVVLTLCQFLLIAPLTGMSNLISQHCDTRPCYYMGFFSPVPMTKVCYHPPHKSGVARLNTGKRWESVTVPATVSSVTSHNHWSLAFLCTGKGFCFRAVSQETCRFVFVTVWAGLLKQIRRKCLRWIGSLVGD